MRWLRWRLERVRWDVELERWYMKLLRMRWYVELLRMRWSLKLLRMRRSMQRCYLPESSRRRRSWRCSSSRRRSVENIRRGPSYRRTTPHNPLRRRRRIRLCRGLLVVVEL